jgi:hypothetical protein
VAGWCDAAIGAIALRLHRKVFGYDDRAQRRTSPTMQASYGGEDEHTDETEALRRAGSDGFGDG